MDHAIPRAHDFPVFELDRTITPSPVNPLGVKGVGEAGTIGSTPAVVNAIVDVLSPLGHKRILTCQLVRKKCAEDSEREESVMIAQNFEYVVPASLGKQSTSCKSMESAPKSSPADIA